VPAGKLNKCLHFLATFIAPKLTIGLMTHYVSVNIKKTIIIKEKANIYTETKDQDTSSGMLPLFL
jgi:hypothetical protein